MLTDWQRRFLYFPAREMVSGPEDYGFAREDVRMTAEDGVRVHAWWLAAPGADTTVLFLHGNAGNVSYWVDAVTVYRDLGWNTLLLDYRGYGLSEGSPSEQGTYFDADAAWQHLVKERAIDPSRVVVIGRSLGGGVATWLARRHRPAALVLEATFTSVANVVAEMLPIPGVRSFVRLGYPSIERIGDIDAPLLVVHGRRDEVVPFSHGCTLFEAARSPKRFVELAGGHNDAFGVEVDAYSAALREFVAEHAGRS